MVLPMALSRSSEAVGELAAELAGRVDSAVLMVVLVQTPECAVLEAPQVDETVDVAQCADA